MYGTTKFFSKTLQMVLETVIAITTILKILRMRTLTIVFIRPKRKLNKGGII